LGLPLAFLHTIPSDRAAIATPWVALLIEQRPSLVVSHRQQVASVEMPFAAASQTIPGPSAPIASGHEEPAASYLELEQRSSAV